MLDVDLGREEWDEENGLLERRSGGPIGTSDNTVRDEGRTCNRVLQVITIWDHRH